MLKHVIATVLTGVTLSFVGCSSDDNSSEDGSGGASGGSGGFGAVGGINLDGSTSGGTGGTGSSITITSEGGQCVLKDSTGCAGESYAPEIIPLDIYIMFDQTGSTCACVDPPDPALTCESAACNASRMDAIRNAATTFLQDPESTGIGVGIGYFGHLPIGQASCDPADYDDPAVGIAPLPGNAGAIINSLNGIRPTGETPSGAAIRGACTYARQWKASNFGHEVVILLLTDGRPEAPVTCPGGVGPCCPTLEDTVAAATDCRNGAPGIKTYVLGVGPFLQNLEQIAAAGGTDHAYLVEGGNVSDDVLTALRAIRGDAIIPCNLQLPAPPAGSALNPNQVNIAYANSACEGTIFHRVETVTGCSDQGGWYYDDPVNPKDIRLCPTSCDQVSDPGGHLLFSVGCTTVVDPT